MSVVKLDEILAKVCAGIDGVKLAHLLNYYPQKIQVGPEQIKCFCPLHEERALRSLVLDETDKTFRCTMKRCVGFEGGSYVDLWSFYHDMEPLDAALELAEKLGLDIDVQSLRGLGATMVEKARTALKDGELEAARSAIDQAVAFLPKDIAAGRVSMEIYRAAGDDDAAQQELMRIVDLCLEQNETAEARKLLDPVVQAQPDSVDVMLRLVALAKAEADGKATARALLDLAEFQARDGKKKEAAQSLSEAEKMAGAEPDVLERIAALHEKCGRATESIEAYRRLVEAYEAAGDLQSLLGALVRWEALDGDNAELQEQIATTLLGLNETEQAADRLLKLAGDSKSLGDWEKGQSLVRRALEAAPENVRAMELLAELCAGAGQTDEAIETLRKLGAQARKSGDGDRATAYLEQARGIDPDDYNLRYDLVQSQLESGATEEVIEELFELANLFIVEPDPARGFEILDKIGELSEGEPDAQIRIGACLETAGFDEEAVARYLKYIDAKQKAGDHEAALRVCEAASALAPHDEALLERRVEACRQLGRPADAVQACRHAAQAQAAAGEMAKAERALLTGVELGPDDAALRADLSALQEKLGQVEQAVKSWMDAARLHRKNKEGERAVHAAREVLRMMPEHVAARTLLAEELEQQGQVAQALQEWKAAAGRLLAGGGDDARALEILEHTLDLAPNDLEALEQTAELKQSVAGPKEAADLYGRWLKQAEDSGNANDLIRAFDKALAIYPNQAAWRHRFAEMLVSRGKAADALEHFESLLATHRAKSKSGTDYLKTLERCAEIYPDNTELRTEWAEALAGVGELEKSSAIFSEMARQCLKAKDLAGGIRVLQKSLEYQPENCDLLAQIAELQEKAGETDEAAAAYERLAEINRRAGEAGANVHVLTKLLQIDEARDDLRLELAQTYEAQNDTERAVEHYYQIARRKAEEAPAGEETLRLFRKIVELAPSFQGGREQLVDCLLERGETAEAKAELDAMGERALEVGDTEAAEAIFKRIQEIDPHDISSGERLGKLYEANGQVEEAAEAYRAVLKVYRKNDDTERCQGVLRKLKGLTPGDLELRINLARTMAKSDADADAIAAEWYDLIQLALNEGAESQADAAMAEAAPYLEDRWDDRFNLTRLIAARKQDQESAALWETLAHAALDADRIKVAINAASEGLCLLPSAVGLREIRIKAGRRIKDQTVVDTDLRILADQHMQNGHYGKAESVLAQAIELRSDSDELIGLLAECQIEQGNKNDALGTLRHLADLHCQRGEIELAIDRARQATELTPEDLEARDYLATLLVEANEVDQAVRTWREIGQLMISRKDAAAALPYFEKVLVHADRDIDTLRAVAGLHLEADDEESAVPHYRRLLEVLSEDLPIDEADAEFQAVLDEHPDWLDVAEQYAVFLFNSGREKEAEGEIVRISRIFLQGHEDVAAALRVIGILAQLDPGSLTVMREEAIIHESAGDVERAADQLRELAEAYRYAGRQLEAAEAIARRAELLPENVEAQVEAAEAFEELHVIDRATEVYLRAIELYDKDGDLNACIPLLKRVIAIEPGRLELREALGKVYDQTKLTEQAIDHWLDLSRHYEEAGKIDRAFDTCRHIKKIAPANMECRDRLVELAEREDDPGSALLELREMLSIARQAGDDERAIRILENILVHQPTDTDAMVARADIHREQDDEAKLFEALGALEDHHRAEGQPSEAMTVLEEMRSLRPDDLGLLNRKIEVLVSMGERGDAAEMALELVRTHLKAGSAAEAEEAVKQATAIEPQSVERRVRLAEMCVEFNQEAMALAEFTRGYEELWAVDNGDGALELLRAGKTRFPEELELRRHLIKTLQRLRRSDEAIDEQLSLADLFVDRAQDEAAMEVLEQVLSTRPEHVATHEAMVTLGLKLGDEDKVVDHLTRLAEIHYGGGRLKEAIGSLEGIVQLETRHNELMLRLAELYYEDSQSDRAHEVWMETAGALRNEGHIDRAISVFERVLENFGTETALLDQLVRCYAEAGPEDKYLATALQLASAYVAEDSLMNAISVYEKICVKFPQNVEALEKLAEANENVGDNDSAAACFRRLFELHEAARRFDRAKAALERAILCGEADALMLGHLGDLCLKLNQKSEGLEHLNAAAHKLTVSGDTARAREVIEKIMKADPANLETRRTLAELCEKTGERAEAVKHLGLAARAAAEKRDDATAIEIYERLFELDPELMKEREAYARLLERQNRGDEACEQYMLLIEALGPDGDTRQKIRYCRQILKDNPDHLAAHECLCRVYEKTGKGRLALTECLWLAESSEAAGERHRAEEWLRRGLGHAPEDSDLLKRLIDLQVAAGRMEEAATMLEELAELARRRSDGESIEWALRRACDVSPAGVIYREQLADYLEKSGQVAEARHIRLEILEVLLARAELEQARQAGERIADAAAGDEDVRRRVAEVFEKAGLPEVAAFHYTVLAKSALTAGRYQDAVAISDKILKIKPRHIAAREHRLEALQALGRNTKAWQESRELYLLHSESDDLDAAERTLKFLIDQKPENAEVRQWTVDLYRNQGRDESMLPHLRRLAEIHADAGNLEKAVEALKEVLAKRPDEIEARARYIDLYTQIYDESELYQDYLLLARAHQKRGNVAEASALYEQLIRAYPDRVESRERFADFLFEKMQIERAVEETRALADIYLADQKVQEANRVLERAIGKAPDDVELRFQLAKLQIKTNRRGLALETLRELLAQYQRSGNEPKQIEILEQMLELDDTNIEQQQQLADLLSKLGRNDEAKTRRIALAELYMARQLFDLAEREFRRVIDLSPDDVAVWEKVIETHLKIGAVGETVPDMLALASLHMDRSRLKEAVTLYKRILEVQPENIEVLQKYVEAYEQIGPEEDLVDDYVKLAELLSRAGRVPEAMEMFTRLRDLAPEDERVQEGLRQTNALAAAVRQDVPPEDKPLDKPGAPRVRDHIDEFLNEEETPLSAGDPQLEKSIHNYENILKLNPDNPSVRAKLADLLTRSGRIADADEHWTHAAGDYYARGELDRCIEIYEDLMTRHPENAHLRERLSRAVIQRDSFKALESVIREPGE